MKKLTAIALLLGLLAGCGAGREATALPEQLPADFAVRFVKWTDADAPNIYDTGEKLLQKDLVDPDGPRTAQAALTVSDEILQAIYAKARDCALDRLTEEKLTSENLTVLGDGVRMTPLTEYEITLTADGQTYTVTGDATAREYTEQNGRAAQFWEFVQYMNELLLTSPEYQALPEPRGGYA
ncbi:hypothetical protein AGATL06_23510 [Agathobaculum sp. TL06]